MSALRLICALHVPHVKWPLTQLKIGEFLV